VFLGETVKIIDKKFKKKKKREKYSQINSQKNSLIFPNFFVKKIENFQEKKH